MMGPIPALDNFSRAVLDSITGMIVIIDADGFIRYSNRAWTRFLSNLSQAHPVAAPGGNYFDFCRWLTTSDPDQYEAVESGLHGLFSDSADPFECALRALASDKQPLFVLRAARVEQAGPLLAVLVHNEAAEIQQSLVRATESRSRKVSQVRESQVLDRLDADTEASATEAFELGLLRLTVPEEFVRLTENYSSVLELAMVHRIYRVAGSVSVRLRVLAEELADVNAHPRDLIEIHKRAFVKKSRGLSPGRAAMLLEEGRLVLLEVMGYLASYYRRAQSPEPRRGTPVSTSRRVKEAKK
jgi:hypothetical protein